MCLCVFVCARVCVYVWGGGIKPLAELTIKGAFSALPIAI